MRRAANVAAIRPFEEWILPWVNEDPARGDRTPSAVISRNLNRFLRSFNGKEAAGFLLAELTDDVGDAESRCDNEDDELSVLKTVIEDRLRRLLPRERGYTLPALEGEIDRVPLRLSFDVVVRRGESHRIVRVTGSRFDLVLYLVLQLIAKTNTTLGRCPAPAPPPYSLHKCDRLFIAHTGTRGQPRKFCVESGDACRDRLRKQIRRHHKRGDR
jgi:hypothetical protein